MANSVFNVVRRVGGARIPAAPPVPSAAGTLIVMNHQSLLDIPMAVQACSPGYPLFVTRARYAKGIPLISHMLRLYDHPLVHPGRGGRRQLVELARRAVTMEVPLLIFPEGGRTRDGQVRPFQPGGLQAILSARPWNVYLMVVDGFWQCARIGDFTAGVSQVDAKVSRLGPFAFDPAQDDRDAFAQDMRDRLVAELARLRGETVSEQTEPDETGPVETGPVETRPDGAT